MVLGDTHGNADWLRLYVYPTAMALGVDRIIQLGDWGYWEHQEAGVQFLDEVSRMATVAEIPVYWLRGNHDKTSLLLQRYGALRNHEGFIYIRDNIYFIPDGNLWHWGGKSFRAFGGAYSVDKSWRLKQEQNNYDFQVRKEQYRAQALGRAPEPVASLAGTLWFPEEEMTDGDMQGFLEAYSGPVDYVFSHDKPRSTNPGWNRKDLPLCLPNQDRLQLAFKAHRPDFWFHGHLHHYYTQQQMTDGGAVTTVISLEPDSEAAELGWQRHNTWALLEIVESSCDCLHHGFVTLGEAAKELVDQAEVNEAKALLSSV